MQERNLFEIPIYRSDGEDLKRAFRKRRELENAVHNFLGIRQGKPPAFPGRKYNDVVGWIVLSIWLNRIRAEYWFVEQRVIIGLKNKTFENRGKLFVYKFGNTNKDSATVYSELLSLLKKSASDRFPKRQVDYACFESIGRYIDWEGLIKGYASNKALQATRWTSATEGRR